MGVVELLVVREETDRVRCLLLLLRVFSAQSAELVRSILAACTEDLERLSGDFKFVLTGFIVPKGPSFGVHASNACVWDSARDSLCSVQFETSVLFCSVFVFAIAR